MLGIYGRNGDKVNMVIVKTDQEPSIEYLIKDLVNRREEARTIIEEAPLESKGSNGIIERTIQDVEGVQMCVPWIGGEIREENKLEKENFRIYSGLCGIFDHETKEGRIR